MNSKKIKYVVSILETLLKIDDLELKNYSMESLIEYLNGELIKKEEGEEVNRNRTKIIK